MRLFAVKVLVLKVHHKSDRRVTGLMGAVNMVNTTNSSRVGGYIAASGLPFVIRTPWEQSPEIDSDENKTSSCKTYTFINFNSRQIHKIIWIPSISDSLIWQVIRVLFFNVVVIWLLRRVVRMEGILEGWWRPVLVLSEVEIFIEPLNALTPVQIILVAAWWW